MKENMDNEELTFDEEFDNTDVEGMAALIASLKSELEDKED